MNPSIWAIRNPFLPLALAVLLAVAGLVALRGLPVTALPALADSRVTIDILSRDGDRPRLDRLVARPLEAGLAALPGLRRIDTDLSDGRLRMTLAFRDIADPADLRARIEEALDALADDAIARDDVTVTFGAARAMPVLSLAVAAGPHDLGAASRIVEAAILPRLQRLDGAGDIRVTGLAPPELFVRLAPDRLASLGIDPAELSRQLGAALAGAPTARMDLGADDRELRLGDGVATPAMLAGFVLRTGDGAEVPLSAVAGIAQRPAPRGSLVRVDGRPAIRIDIFAAAAADEPGLARRAEAAARTALKAHPDLRMTVLERQSEASAKRLAATWRIFAEALGLVTLVLLAVLRSPRAAAVAMAALPLSIAPCFLILAGLGISLNMVSLLALVLATGILVDDAIVEIENIERQVRLGHRPAVATERATAEIGLAVLATSACILAIFLPVTALDGTTARYFHEFGMTLAAATACSLLVARLVVPPLAARWLSPATGPARRPGRWSAPARWHRRALSFGLRRPGVVLAVTSCAIAAACLALARMPGDFIPAEDGGTIAVRLDLPEAMARDAADGAVAKIAAGLAGTPGIARIVAVNAPDGRAGEARLELHLAPRGPAGPEAAERELRRRSRTDIEADLRRELAALPDVRATLIDPADGAHFVVQLAAADAGQLAAVMRELAGRLALHPDFRAVLPPGRSQVATVLAQDFERLEALGIAPDGVRQLLPMLDGSGLAVGQIFVPVQGLTGHQPLPVVVGLPGDAADQVHLVGRGAPVALTYATPRSAEVAEVRTLRRDGRPVMTLEAELAPGVDHGHARSAVAQALAALGPRAAGLEVLPVGDGEARAEMMRDMRAASLAGLALMLSILVLLYRSAVQALVVLATLPFALGGGMIGLAALGLPVSLPVLLGTLLLLGIVAKNTILVVDHAQRRRRQGGLAPALLLAGRRRARAVVTTSLAMCAGMLPAALGLGDGAAFRQPLAIAVIAGVLASTGINLVVVPALSLLADRTERSLIRASRLLVRLPVAVARRTAATVAAGRDLRMPRPR